MSQISVAYPRDRWPAGTVAAARRRPASACPTSRSAPAARQPRCTAPCGGRHVLLVPVGAASVLNDPGLRPYRRDSDVVTGDVGQPPRIHNDGAGPVVLVRPDGYVAARGRPGSMRAVTGYLHYLLGEPAGEHVGERPAAEAPGR